MADKRRADLDDYSIGLFIVLTIIGVIVFWLLVTFVMPVPR